MQRGIFAHIQCQRRLSHGRSCCNQNQISGLQPGELVVEVRKSRGNTSDVALKKRCLLNFGNRIHHDIPDRRKFRNTTALRQIENPLLRAVHDRVNALCACEAVFLYFLAALNQAPQNCLFRHDIGIGAHVG